jgi:hypothetical protein
MKFKVDKVKNVLKPNSKEYYNYLDTMKQNMINKKKKDIKDTRGSILKTNETNFEIREFPDNTGSNYSSVKKESHIRDDLNSEIQISSKNDPLKIKDFEEFAKNVSEFGNICGSLKEYLNFEMGSDVILDMIASSKKNIDETYHQFVMSYKKCTNYGAEGPKLVESEKEGEYDWPRLKKDAREIKMLGDTFYEDVQMLLKKKLEFKTGKKKLQSFDSGVLVDFVFEKYKKKAGGGNANKSENELFDSNIKEEKEEKKDYDFDMQDGEDVFGGHKEGSPETKPTTFALDQENDAFTDFNSKKKQVIFL